MQWRYTAEERQQILDDIAEAVDRAIGTRIPPYPRITIDFYADQPTQVTQHTESTA